MVWLQAVLIVAAAVLPAIAFVLFFVRAQRTLKDAERTAEERGATGATFDDFNQEYADITRKPRQVRDDVRLEALLVGAGAVCGSLAGLWSLFG